jgi:hypothetical protein
MNRRRFTRSVHPFAPVFLFVVAAAILWPLHHFFGVGTRLFEFAESLNRSWWVIPIEAPSPLMGPPSA